MAGPRRRRRSSTAVAQTQTTPDHHDHSCAGCLPQEQTDMNGMIDARVGQNLPGWHWVLSAVSSPPMVCKSEDCLGLSMYISFNNVSEIDARTEAMLPFRILLKPMANGWPHSNPQHFYHAGCAERLLSLGSLAKDGYMYLAPQFLPDDNQIEWPPMFLEWFSRGGLVDVTRLGAFVEVMREWLELDRACKNLFRQPSCPHSAPPCEACVTVTEDSNPTARPLIGEYDIDSRDELSLGALLAHRAVWTQFSGTGYLGAEFD